MRMPSRLNCNWNCSHGAPSPCLRKQQRAPRQSEAATDFRRSPQRATLQPD